MKRIQPWAVSGVALLLLFVGVPWASADEEPAAIELDTPLAGGAPHVVGMSQDDALEALDDAGLEPRIVTITSDKVGVVLHQEPAAGKDIHTGDELTIRVGIKALVQTQVPDVIGMDESALDVLDETYFVEVTYVQGEASKVGLVVSQTPAAGASLAARGLLKVSVVRGNSIVPNVVGKTEADARKILAGARLSVDIKHAEDDKAADGTVLSQDPASGSEALPMSTITLRVAGHAHDHGHEGDQPELDPAQDDIGVPSLVGRLIDQAQDALFALQLVPAPEFVDAPAGTPAWTVLSQDPAAGARVGPGTIVRFQVAKEVAPEPTIELKQVPSVVGYKADQASATLYSNALKPRKIFRTLPDGVPNRVAEQYPSAGSLVPLGTRVTYVLPRTAIVPQLLGSTKAEAFAALAGHGFKALAQQIGIGGGPTKVTWQRYPAGSVLASGSTVQFKYSVVTIAQPLVHVPHVLGSSRTAAKAQLQAKGFLVATQNVGGAGPFTEVVAQNPNGGSLRVHGSTVQIKYKRKGFGGLLKPVPHVLGKSRNQAKAILQGAGFQVTSTKVGGGGGPITQVIDQDPNGGQLRPHGFLVKIKWRYKLIGILKPIPNVIGKTRNQAKAILEGAGFTVQTQKIGGNGPLTEVVDTDPNPGVLRAAGSQVLVKYKRKGGIGFLKPVPHVLGKTRNQGRAILIAAGFQVQLIPVGGVGTSTRIVNTNPSPGQLRAVGSTVQVRYQRIPGGGGGVVLATVPNLIGRTKAQAKVALQARGLAWKFVGPFLAPRVKGQNRPAGSKVPKGTQIVMSVGF